jgi:hypothetical protein
MMVVSSVDKWIDNAVIYVSCNLDDDDLDALIMRLIRLSKQRELKRGKYG